jgi:O-antigen/teichoic acid export membrane protein
MSLTRQIAWNTIIQASGKIIGVFLGILTVAVMTRYLGQEGFGEYTTIIAFLQFTSVIADLGLYLVLTNEIARPNVDLNHTLNNFFTLRFYAAVFFLLLVSSLVWIFPYPLIIKYGVIINSFSIFFILLIQILTSLFQKELKMDRVAIAEIIGKIVFLSLTLGAIFFKMSLLAILLASVLGAFINFLIVSISSLKYTKLALEFDFPFWRKIIKKSWPVAVSSLFVLVYFKADTIILSLYKSQSEVGLYGAAYKVLEVLATFPALFMGLVSPVLARTHSEKNMERFERIFQKSFDFLIILSWPTVIGTIILAKPMMILVGGRDFAAAGEILQILIIATGIIFLSHLAGYSIIAIEKQKQMVKFYIMAAIGAFLAYIIFIPIYSYFGAAIITLLAETFIFVAGLCIVLKSTHIKISLKNFGKSLFASLIMALFLYYLAGENLFFAIIGGGLIYFIILYLIKGISKEMVTEVFRLNKSGANIINE